MAEISAAAVVKLRKMSGQSMGECKKALEEANGDMDKATEILRKKGLATLAKRAERETTEGAVVAWQSPDGKTAAMATLCCETDFVAKSDDFVALAKDLRDYIATGRPQRGSDHRPPDRGCRQELPGGPDRSRQQDRREDAGRRLRAVPARQARGSSASTSTSTRKWAAWCRSRPTARKSLSRRRSRQAAADFAMHVTASKPIALDAGQRRSSDRREGKGHLRRSGEEQARRRWSKRSWKAS